MSEKLTPKVGDRVRLVHPCGDEATVTVEASKPFAIVSLSDRCFWYVDGWSVAEILEKPKPPAGTQIKGVDLNGDEFKAFVTLSGYLSGVVFEDAEWTTFFVPIGSVMSWEVVS